MFNPPSSHAPQSHWIVCTPLIWTVVDGYVGHDQCFSTWIATLFIRQFYCPRMSCWTLSNNTPWWISSRRTYWAWCWSIGKGECGNVVGVGVVWFVGDYITSAGEIGRLALGRLNWKYWACVDGGNWGRGGYLKEMWRVGVEFWWVSKMCEKFCEFFVCFALTHLDPSYLPCFASPLDLTQVFPTPSPTKVQTTPTTPSTAHFLFADNTKKQHPASHIPSRPIFNTPLQPRPLSTKEVTLSLLHKIGQRESRIWSLSSNWSISISHSTS